MKSLANILAALFTAMRVSFIVAAITILIAMISAPVFFGVVIITAGVVSAIWFYTMASFVVTIIYKLFFKENADVGEPAEAKS